MHVHVMFWACLSERPRKVELKGGKCIWRRVEEFWMAKNTVEAGELIFYARIEDFHELLQLKTY